MSVMFGHLAFITLLILVVLLSLVFLLLTDLADFPLPVFSLTYEPQCSHLSANIFIIGVKTMPVYLLPSVHVLESDTKQKN